MMINTTSQVMIAIQFIYAVMSISSRAALLKGMSPRVFVVYRQAMATLAILHQLSISLSKHNHIVLILRYTKILFLLH
ncbi:unnamed protein product, partial [Vitis vinifera]|uniref:WAT1-related protein n=1 Tax=Vitis vinifera TaxID=29760 RepID=D7U1J2_VITVI